MTDQVTLPSDKSTGTAGAGTQRQYCRWVPKWCLVKQHWTGTRDGLQTTKIPKVVLGAGLQCHKGTQASFIEIKWTF